MAATALYTILMKNEVTQGVDSAPNLSDGILVGNLVVNPVGELVERKLNSSSFSQFPHVVGSRWYEASFEVELKGSGTANGGGADDVPEIDPILRSMGFAATLTAESSNGAGDGKIEYSPVSTGLETASVWCYLDGKLKKINFGFVNSFSFSAEAGKTMIAEMSIIGRYLRPIDGVTPAGIVYNSIKPAIFQNANLSIGGWSPEFDKFSLDVGLTIATRKDGNTVGAIKGFTMTERTITGSLDPAQESEATHPIHQRWEDATEMAFSAQIGQDAGNIIEITAPKVQYREINEGDREGLGTYEVPLTFARSSGDDEIKFTFK